VKFLFALNTPGFLRYFDVTIDALLDRGHDVALTFTRSDLRPESLELYEGRDPRPEVLADAPVRTDRWAGLAADVRSSADFLRYLHPRYAEAEYLRNRMRMTAVSEAPVMRRLGLRRSLPRPLPNVLIRGLLAVDRAIPSAPEVEAFLRAQQPDALLVSPLVNAASPAAPQTDLVKSARKLGIPCGVLVASWDNLTNKGLIRTLPDVVVVWNEAQAREAVELHGVPRSRIAVTGAQPFDRWFGREPSLDRETFCRRAALDPGRPYAMFVGSTGNIARRGVEEEFVRDWIRALRASGRPELAELGVLVRPHPDRQGAWEDVDLGDDGNAVVWPPTRPDSVSPAARTDYFDSLFHATAIVGINTSAMVEAAVIGRPVLTLRTPEFEQAQAGTLHFRHLLPENGGHVIVADSVDEHLRQLAEALTSPDAAAAGNRRFVESFIRPRGLDRPANEVLVAELERLAATDPGPGRTTIAAAAVRPLLGVAARRTARPIAPRERAARSRRRWQRAAAGVRRVRVPPATALASQLERLGERRAEQLRRREKTAQAERKARRRELDERGGRLLEGDDA
jgi:hypothetical protein